MWFNFEPIFGIYVYIVLFLWQSPCSKTSAFRQSKFGTDVVLIYIGFEPKPAC
jgi:hypothetical protein